MVKKAVVGTPERDAELDEFFGDAAVEETKPPAPQMQAVTTSDGKEYMEVVDSGQKLTLHAPSSLWNYYGSFSLELPLGGMGYEEVVSVVQQWRENVVSVLLEEVPEDERSPKPSDKQIAFLARLGYDGDAPKTMEEASALIDSLTNKDKVDSSPAPSSAPAATSGDVSEKQVGFIQKLLKDKAVPDSVEERLSHVSGNLEALGKSEASAIINELMAAPKKSGGTTTSNADLHCAKCGAKATKPPQVKGSLESYVEYITGLDETKSDKYKGHKPSGEFWCYDCRAQRPPYKGR